jgi:DNA-binding transcriptional MerR regulator
MDAITLPDPGVEVPAAGLTIGDVARLSGLSVETLRYYEREGLLLEHAQRDPAGRRRYGTDDLAWIGALLMLRDTGMSISDMRALAALSRQDGTERERLDVLEGHRRRILDDLDRTRRHLTALEKKIAAYREVVDPPATRTERNST